MADLLGLREKTGEGAADAACGTDNGGVERRGKGIEKSHCFGIGPLLVSVQFPLRAVARLRSAGIGQAANGVVCERGGTGSC